MTVDWRKWGLGGSIEFGEPIIVRLWLGPVRFGIAYGYDAEEARP